jgi:Flp pilus assembly protein TadG
MTARMRRRRRLDPARRRRTSGGAILELVLVLPTYVMLLFIMMTLSEFGQVAGQAYTAGRILAWERSDRYDEPRTTHDADRVHAEYFRHFARRVRVKTSGGRMIEPMREDGERRGGVTLANGTVVVAGAHAFPYRALADPLYHDDGATLHPVYQDDAAGANLAALADMALRGSRSAPRRRTVPWLRRHYAAVWVTYYPVDNLFGLRTRINIVHTVLRGVRANTAAHAPYRFGRHPGDLRDVEGYRYSGVVNIATDNHQLDFMGVEADFEPDLP